MPDEWEDDETVIQQRDDEMTNPELPTEALSEPTLPKHPPVAGRAVAPAARPPAVARSSSEDIAAAISSAIASVQLPVAGLPPPVVPDMPMAMPFAAQVAPPATVAAPIAPAPPRAPPADAQGATAVPGWVVRYVLVTFLLTALGVAVLAWWKAHGLW